MLVEGALFCVEQGNLAPAVREIVRWLRLASRPGGYWAAGLDLGTRNRAEKVGQGRSCSGGSPSSHNQHERKRPTLAVFARFCDDFSWMIYGRPEAKEAEAF